MIKWQKIILHHMVCSVSSSVVEIQFYSKMGDFTKYIFKQHNRTTNCRAAVIVIYRRVLQSPIALLAPPLRSDAPFFQTHAQKATLLCWSLGRKQIYYSSSTSDAAPLLNTKIFFLTTRMDTVPTLTWYVVGVRLTRSQLWRKNALKLHNITLKAVLVGSN